MERLGQPEVTNRKKLRSSCKSLRSAAKTKNWQVKLFNSGPQLLTAVCNSLSIENTACYEKALTRLQITVFDMNKHEDLDLAILSALLKGIQSVNMQ